MRVLFVTPECAPLVKAGGLGDVSASLPAALRQLGHEVDVLLPGYGEALAKVGAFEDEERCAHLGFEARLRRAGALLFVDCPPLYARGGGPYQDPGGQDWPDNALRFGLLSRVAAELGGRYDVVHCNDWPAALTPAFAHAERTLLTIHNLAFQGNYEPSWLSRLGLSDAMFTMEGLEFHGRVSFLKAGLVYSAALNTVSPTYAREIQSAEHGCGFDGLLRARASALTGILNGIDPEVWDPARDPHLAAHYDLDDLQAKAANKRELQRRLNLEINADLPLLGFVGRLTHQKGADLIALAAAELVGLHAQLAVLGQGERDIEAALSAVAARHPGRVAVAIGFDEPLAHRIEAGADLFLMPSRFEPCGLNQMYSQRYGTPPVARATGGLVDTVVDGQTGFLFERAEGSALAAAVRRALAAWREPARWREIQRAGMQRDFSWRAAARQYADLYSRLARGRVS
jgi:starch synthase